MSRNKINSVYGYLNYREYLRDYFAYRKKHHRHFSYRYFAQLAGYNSSGLLIDITKGKKDVGPSTLDKISKALGLNRKEAEYFKNLVYFNQAQSTIDKSRYFESLLSTIRSKGHVLETKQFKYYSKWYYTAIRELLAIIRFKGNYRDITCRLKPTISLAQAKNAIKTLQQYGFIKKDYLGYYRPAYKHITSGSKIRSLSLSNFQRATMDLAKEAIDRFSSEEREISTLTFSVAKGDLQKMKKEINLCQAKLVRIVKESKGMDMVGQLNYQLFPLTK